MRSDFSLKNRRTLRLLIQVKTIEPKVLQYEYWYMHTRSGFLGLKEKSECI